MYILSKSRPESLKCFYNHIEKEQRKKKTKKEFIETILLEAMDMKGKEIITSLG